jgi:hypothetical protein
VDDGTKLVFTFQGAFFEGADGPQYREMGWRKLIGRLMEQLAPHQQLTQSKRSG